MAPCTRAGNHGVPDERTQGQQAEQERARGGAAQAHSTNEIGVCLLGNGHFRFALSCRVSLLSAHLRKWCVCHCAVNDNTDEHAPLAHDRVQPILLSKT